MNPGTDYEEKLPGKTLRQLKKGDLYRVVQAGAGGYGDPLERDMHAAADDVEQENLSIEYVRREYGVVVDPNTSALDIPATEKLRAEMSASNSWPRPRHSGESRNLRTRFEVAAMPTNNA